ncbi:MAG: BsaWI family type II restriction enzyme [Aquificaceae bacterium]
MLWLESVLKVFLCTKADPKQSWKPFKGKLLAIISSKTTLRKRIAQTGYWKLKLASICITKNIKAFFITLDEDGDLTTKHPAKKGRAIAEIDTNGTYVMVDNDRRIDESCKVKPIKSFLKILKSYGN